MSSLSSYSQFTHIPLLSNLYKDLLFSPSLTKYKWKKSFAFLLNFSLMGHVHWTILDLFFFPKTWIEIKIFKNQRNGALQYWNPIYLRFKTQFWRLDNHPIARWVVSENRKKKHLSKKNWFVGSFEGCRAALQRPHIFSNVTSTRK